MTTDAPWTPTEPPRRITRVSSVYWFFRGIDAADAGWSAEGCPFDPNESVTDFFLAHWWLRGWRHRRAQLQDPSRSSD